MTGRLDLLDILQSQLKLFRRQGFSPPPEPVSLQLLDDLTQPLALAPLGKQHRFQRLGIVRQRVTRHDQIRSYSAELCDDLPGS